MTAFHSELWGAAKGLSLGKCRKTKVANEMRHLQKVQLRVEQTNAIKSTMEMVTYTYSVLFGFTKNSFMDCLFWALFGISIQPGINLHNHKPSHISKLILGVIRKLVRCFAGIQVHHVCNTGGNISNRTEINLAWIVPCKRMQLPFMRAV